MRTATFVLCALVLALGGTTYGLYERNASLGRANKTLTDAAERASKRETEYRRILGTRANENASQARKLAEANAALSAALQRNKSWSDTDVPPDVQSALGGPSGGPAGVLQHD